MDKRLYLAIKGAIICALVASCTGRRAVPEFDYEVLNAQAAAEYMQPVHPASGAKSLSGMPIPSNSFMLRRLILTT
jgi:hypothetical protein